MEAISLAELATRARSTEERVRRLVHIGVLPDRGTAGFEPDDVQRVGLAEALDRAGISFDAVGQAVAKGALSFDFLKSVLPAPPDVSPTTFREEALEDAGIAVPKPAHPPAIAFLDLTGYTRMTEELGDEAAAEHSGALSRVMQDPVARHAGNVVKLLGDGVLMHFPEPANAVACGMDLVRRVPAAGLPSARVGVAAGPVVWRDGDVFGRTVNVASRIVGVAGPGESW